MTSSLDRITGLTGNLGIKIPVRVYTQANITLSGEQTIDGVAVSANDGTTNIPDRVLVGNNQTTGTERGIYDVSTGAWTRSADFDGNRDIAKGTLIAVTNGAISGGFIYSVSTSNPITIGTTSLTFAVSGLISGLGTIATQNANAVAITGGTGYFTGTTGTALRSTTSGSLVGVEIIDTGAFGACLKLIGDGATTPSKTIRATCGTLDILNNAVNNVIIRVNDAGDITGSRSITLNSATGVTNAGDVNITGDIRKNGNLVSPTQIITGSTTYNPPSLIDGAGTTTTVTATGAALGDIAVASFSLDLQGITVTAYISSANTVSVRFQNETTGTLDLASGTLKVMVTKI